MSKLVPGRGVSLTNHQIRLSIASEPATFLFLLGSLFTTFILADALALGLATAALFSVVTASPWIGPLRRRAGARTRHHRERLRTRQRRLKEQQILRALPLALQNRFWVIRNRVWSVSHSLNAGDEASEYASWCQVQEQLARLPETTLHLLRDLNNVERLLEQADELLLYRQLDELEKEIHDASPRLHAIKVSRQAILRRRQDLFQQAHEEREVILTQLAMIEDIIDLLRDSSLIADDTNTVTRQLNDMMHALDAIEEAIKDTHAATAADEVAELAIFEQRLAG